jgi:hypothetical protein
VSNDLIYGVAVLVLGAAIIYGVFSYASAPAAQASAGPEAGAPILQFQSEASDSGGAASCAEGEEKSCTTSNSCSGKQFCVGGKWSGCVRYDQICEPNAKESCSYTLDNGACGYGSKTCNSCGNGWSGCA